MEIEKRPDMQMMSHAMGDMMPGAEPVVQKIGSEQLLAFTKILEEYRAGQAQTEKRILASENWWKLRNSAEERKDSEAASGDGFKAVSGWLHNVIVSKHADAAKAYPEPNILPREQGDKGEAMMLSAIIPCILEQNNFEATYSEAQWQKLKTGTGCYKVVWDASKNGIGDIHVERKPAEYLLGAGCDRHSAQPLFLPHRVMGQGCAGGNASPAARKAERARLHQHKVSI